MLGLIIPVLLALIIPYPSLALDVKPGGEIFEDFRMEKNYRDTDENGAVIKTDAIYNLLSLYPSLALTFENQIKMISTADITWFSPFDDEEENEAALSILDAYALFQSESMAIQAGLMPVEAGKGYLFSGNEPGVRLSGKISSRNHLTIQAAAIYHQSPFITAELEYRFRFLEDISLFGAWFIDKDDSVAALFDAIDSNTCSISYVGGRANFFLGNVYVSLMAMTQMGDISLELDLPSQNGNQAGRQRWQTKTDNSYDIDLSGYLFDMDMGINLTESLSLTAFCLVASGDGTPLDNHFEGFVLLMPDIRMAPVFFEGIGNQLSTTDSIHFTGVEREGVIAPGIKLGFKPDDRFFTELSFTYLYPEEKPSPSQDDFGWEADIKMTLEWGQNRSIFAEAGMFVPGDYFPADSSEPDRVSRIRMGFYLAF
ncbi:MAG: hypothetical protein KJ737_04200 [Proteobacteria bacterium]|nr:hypothetical protein [Pseudomonadota bacterium]